MVASLRPQHLILPVAPLTAGIIGILTVGMFAVIPTELLESLVVDSGIAAVLSAAEPPLGLTARLMLALVCGGGVALIAWFALFLTFGMRTVVIKRKPRDETEAPVLRRADAHPDAPARRPLFANTDLGTPFLEVRASAVHIDAGAIDAGTVVEMPIVLAAPMERAIPADLDQPMSDYDPAALPDEPAEWTPAPPLAPRRQIFETGERFETFPLIPTPSVEPAPEPAPEPVIVAEAEPIAVIAAPSKGDPAVTIHALLDRLERVAAKRDSKMSGPPVPRETIEDTLSTLRKMATGGR